MSATGKPSPLAPARSRRDFVKSVAAGSAVAVGLPSVLAGERRTMTRRQISGLPGESPASQVAPSDRIGLAVIGAGGMGMADVDTALRIPGVELVAACDIFDGRLDAARERHGDISTTRDYREVLARDDVDAVIVGTPDHWHQPISVDALRSGKAVYCEKPMVHSVAEGHGLIEAQEESGNVFQVGSQGMSSLGNEKAKALYEEGAIGELNYAEGFWARNDPLGAWQYPIPAGASEETVDWKRFLGPAPELSYDPLRVFRWRNYRDYGTGVAGDLFVHLFSSLHFVVSSRGPTRIQAAGGLRYWKDGREAPDVLLGMFDYPENRHAPGFQPVAARQFRGWNFRQHLPAAGRERGGNGRDLDRRGAAQERGGGPDGRLLPGRRWPRRRRPPRTACPPGLACGRPSRSRYEVERGYRGAHVDHFCNFFQAIRGGPPVLEDAVFGLRAAAPALACNLSYFQDRIVHWDPERHEARLMGETNRVHTIHEALLAVVLAAGCADVPKSPPDGSADSGMATPAAEQVAPPNTLTEAERAAGWRLLFDGETAEGWRGYNREEFPDTGWAVMDGMLVVGATAVDPDVPVGGDIVTTESFTDFDLKFDFMLSRGGQQRRPLPGDRGGGRRDLVQRPRVPGAGRPGVHRDGHDGHEHPSHRRQLRPARGGGDDPAWTRRVEPGPHPHPEQPGGALAERDEDGGVRARLSRMGGTGRGPASSRPIPVTAAATSGPIGVQDHGRNVWYRSIKILPLGPVSLFNGGNLDGWQVHGTERWYVENGELVCESGPDAEYGYLTTDQTFRDFDLTVDFRQEADGNSGGVLPRQRRGDGRERLAGRSRAARAVHGRHLRVVRPRLAGATRPGAGRGLSAWATGTPCASGRWAIG